MTYQELLEVTAVETSSLRDEDSSYSANEIEIQSHWFAGHFPETFTGNHGQSIKIISLGEWNRGPGPDFIAATVDIDGERHTGPIEIDLDSRNWDLHGHATNPDFDSVILHVVLHDSQPTYFTRTSSHREVPRIFLSQEDLTQALDRPRLRQALARPGRCLQPLAGLSPQDTLSLLKEAALYRAQEKATRFRKSERYHSFSQSLWETFADSLGFSENRLPMRLLAQRIPIAQLSQFSHEEIEAILFGSAGFLSPELHKIAPPESRHYLESLWECWWKHRPSFEFHPERSPSWSSRSTRPGNHPQRRLAALTHAGTQWKSLAALARQDVPFEKFTQALGELRHSFWDHHHTLKSSPFEKPMRLIGPGRMTEFLINTLYPLSLEENNAAWETYAKIRAASPNQKVKRCAERLFGSMQNAKPFLTFAWQQQGLLQIYRDFCLEDTSDCENCPFPEQLSQWTS